MEHSKALSRPLSIDLPKPDKHGQNRGFRLDKDKMNLRLLLPLLILTLLLGACALRPNISAPETSASSTPLMPANAPTEVVLVDSITPLAPEHQVTVSIPQDQSPSDVPSVTPSSYGDCGWQWAYQNLPELTTQFDQAVKGFIPNSNSHATAFGENCLGNDGQVIRFAAMETDFYVMAPVQTLDDYETFGNWVADVMQLVINLPVDILAGPKPGFVEFSFEKSTSERIIFRVPIEQYKATTMGITGEELFRMFYTQP
jgi:hypothetical protein